jgi:hypothetical protein
MCLFLYYYTLLVCGARHCKACRQEAFSLRRDAPVAQLSSRTTLPATTRSLSGSPKISTACPPCWTRILVTYLEGAVACALDTHPFYCRRRLSAARTYHSPLPQAPVMGCSLSHPRLLCTCPLQQQRLLGSTAVGQEGLKHLAAGCMRNHSAAVLQTVMKRASAVIPKLPGLLRPLLLPNPALFLTAAHDTNYTGNRKHLGSYPLRNSAALSALRATFSWICCWSTLHTLPSVRQSDIIFRQGKERRHGRVAHVARTPSLLSHAPRLGGYVTTQNGNLTTFHK